MTLFHTVDVFCDHCDEWIHGATSVSTTQLARKALKEAKRHGWSRSTKSVYRDLCPKCLMKERRDEE